jgi:uncharacterized protein (DUF2141 family)
LRALERETQVVPNDGGLTSIFNQTSLLVSQYQGDQEFEEIAKTIMHKAAPPAPPAPPPAPAPRAPRKSLAEILAPVKDKAVVLMAAASAASAKGAAPLIERGRKALHQPLAEIERRKLTLPLTALATILAVVGMAYIYKVFIRPSDVVPSAASVPLIVEVNPAGARYSVVDQNGTDVTESTSALKPGKYTVRASLMGYEPREVGIDVNPGGPVTARVVLPPIPPSFVLENEREGAQLLLDGQPLTAGENGNFIQKGLSDSEHKAEIAWNNYKIALSFRASRAAIPEILSFESPKDLKALAVTEFGGQVKVWRPTGVPDIMQVSLDAEAPELIGPTGQKEAATAPGAHTLNLVMDGDKRELSLNAGAGPQVLVFLAGDDYGYLAVDAGLPDIKVFIDGRERRSTRGGGTKTSRVVQLRPGEYAVRVVAPEHEPGEVKVAVEKGKVKLQKFGLKAIPQFATLVVLNGKDFSVSIDGEAPNTVSSDKSELNVAPGRKNIHITHPKYEDWSGAREFVVNEPLTIDIAKLGLKEKWSGARVAFVVTPPDAPAAIRVVERANTGSNVPFSTANPLFGKGKYTAIADAPGYKQGAEPFDIAENQQTARVEIKMERIVAPGPPLPPPPPKVFIENFDSSRNWSKGPGGSYVRKSDATTFYKGPGYGVFELVTLCKKGFFGGDCRAKVYVGYQDVVHNVSFDVKKKTVDIRGEDGTVQTKNHNQDFPEKLRLRITVQPNRVKLDAFSMGKWVTIATYDDPKVPLTKGRFGIQYADTLYDFKHTP